MSRIDQEVEEEGNDVHRYVLLDFSEVRDYLTRCLLLLLFLTLALKSIYKKEEDESKKLVL